MKSIIAPLLIFSVLLHACHSNEEKKKNIAPINSQESILQNLVSSFPDSILLKENLLQYYRDSSNYPKAIQTANTFLQSDSNNTRLWHIKGLLEFESEDTINAVHSFQQAFSLSPNATDAIYFARIFAYQKNADCLSACDGIIKEFGTNYLKEVLLIKGIYFAGIGENKKALLSFDSSMHESYTFMEPYLQKASTLMNMKRYQEAINVLIKATTIQNSFEEGYYLLGQCYEKLNQIDAAVDAYQKALFYAPDNTEAKDALEKINKI